MKKKNILKMKTSEFQEPEDYSIKNPKVTIAQCDYPLWEGGSLSEATPKALVETIEMYQSENISNSA